MKLIGIRLEGETHTFVARRVNDTTAEIIDTVDGFWANPFLAQQRQPTGKLINLATATVVPPVLPGAKVFCIGLNYHAHVAEGTFKNQDLPEYPTLFSRWTSTLVVDGTPIPIPSNEAGIDWECEIAAFVGKTIVDADADTARQAVYGYAAFNDVTSRWAQKVTSQWTLGKNGDNSGPLGDIVTVDEAGDLRDGLRVQTRVNGEIAQDGNTRDMIYELGETLAHISKTITLRPSDVIATGTPEGVGYARTPAWLLQPGDVVEVEIERIGKVSNPIVSNDFRHQAVKA
jgi:2-keto-4-pentenoate hydratase/2-oxohepta-3-ene-1,7-dioic acid hydratase in catechol pathway